MMTTTTTITTTTTTDRRQHEEPHPRLNLLAAQFARSRHGIFPVPRTRHGTVSAGLAPVGPQLTGYQPTTEQLSLSAGLAPVEATTSRIRRTADELHHLRRRSPISTDLVDYLNTAGR
jgi:hypothetical protein